MTNDGSHEHLDWKPVASDNKLNFPTSSEAAYPFPALHQIA